MMVLDEKLIKPPKLLQCILRVTWMSRFISIDTMGWEISLKTTSLAQEENTGDQVYCLYDYLYKTIVDTDTAQLSN